MKQLHFLSKKFINFLVIVVLVIKNVIADDCATIQTIFSLMGDEMINEYKSKNLLSCCEFKNVVTCDNQNYVTEL